MNILIVHNNYQVSGGEYAAVEAQTALLEKNGHNVIRYFRHNQEIQDYSGLEKLAFFPRTIYSSRIYDELSNLIARERPDIAHVHNVFPLISPSAYVALKDSGIPIIQTLHNFRFLCPNSLFFTQGQVCERCKIGNTLHAVQLRCYRNSRTLSALYAATIGLHRSMKTFDKIDRFIALTEFTLNKFCESGLTKREKIRVLGNFIVDTLPEKQNAEKRISPYILYIGRLSGEKGVDFLLQAMTKLPGVQVKIAGNGDLEEHLRSLSKELGLSNIEFLGYTIGQQKWDLIKNASATIVPSICYETFSISVLESMSVATPVIASRIGSLPYLINEGNTGLMFTPGDAGDLAEKIDWILQHPNEGREMGYAGRKVVEQSFTGDRHYKQLMAIYGEVLS